MNSNQTINNFDEIDKNLISYPTSLIHMNIRSLRKNFIPFLTHIKNITNKIHLIILTETNITDEENNLYCISGYNATFLNREGRGGGIAVYINENLNFETITINTNSFESMQINIKTNNKNALTVIPVYRPPSHCMRTFIEELDECLNNINKKQNTIVVGDINIDIKRDNAVTTNYLDMFASHGLRCMVTETTREDVYNNTSTCIDHIFIRCNIATATAHSAVITTTISDHYALFGCIEEGDTAEQNTQTAEQGSDFNKKINNDKVNRLIKETNWNTLIENSNNTEQLYNSIHSTFCEIYDESKEQHVVKSKKRKPYPWLNNELIKCCDIRDRLHKNWQKNKTNTINEKIYKTYSNKLNKKIINAKNAFNYRQLQLNRNNIRGTWQIINNITGRKTCNIDKILIRNFSSNNIQKLTESFAHNFKENVQNILHTCNIKTNTNPHTVILNSMYLNYTNEDEIYSILKNLNVRKTPGADGIRAIDLKKNASCLTKIITKLVNSSLIEATIPELLKTSIIRPIYKNGTKTDFNNYRPISILPILEKVLEEIVVMRLNDFLTKYKIINKNQYGFQKGKNINQLLGLFSNHINQNVNNRQQCLALFIDFSKAFDTLSHEKLIETLERTGIRGECLEWMKNYLQCRNFRVKIENSQSSNTDITHGVPQGSKLGPLLYIIYANEMLNQLKESAVFAYADDTAIVVSHECIHTAETTMQKELNTITRWCHDNGLIINANKTKIMHIRPRHIQHTDVTLIFHNTDCLHNTFTNNNIPINDKCSTKIELVTTYKYLGVHLDENFKWKIHIDKLQKKLRQSMFALYNLSKCSPHNVLKQAYFSLAESYLRHGITAWGTASHCRTLQLTQNRILKLLQKNQKYTKNKLQSNIENIHTRTFNHFATTNTNIQNNIQNIQTQTPIRCTTTNTNIQNSNTHENRNQISHNQTDLFKDLEILNIDGLYKTSILNEFYDEPNLLQHIDHQQNTRRRAERRYKIPSFRNDYGKKSLAVTLPTTMNNLPTNLLNINNRISRKKLIKKHFLH